MKPKKVPLFHFPRNTRFTTPLGICVTSIHSRVVLLSWFTTRSMYFILYALPREFFRKLLQVSLRAPFFNCERSVVLICAYLTPATTPACAALRASLGQTHLAALHAYVIKLRRDYEVVFVGDLNGWTGCEAGWEGEDAA